MTSRRAAPGLVHGLVVQRLANVCTPILELAHLGWHPQDFSFSLTKNTKTHISYTKTCL